MENVGALTHRGLDRVLGSLAEIGYDAEWQDIRASDMGAPHRRERIWIVAYPQRQRLEERRSTEPAIETQPRLEHGSETLADTTHEGNVRRDGELESAQGEVREHRRGPQDGRREWWAAEPDVRGISNELS